MNLTKNSFILRVLIFFNIFVTGSFSQVQNQIPVPAKSFGFIPGSDRNLFNYKALISYLKQADAASDKMKMIEVGTSPMGKPMYLVFISSAKNIANLENLRKINKELAFNPNLSETERSQYFKEGKAFLLATLSMHSGEVGPSQAAPLIVYELLTSNDPKMLAQLDEVVFMFVPCHNPDGMNMVVNNYKRYKGTKYEGASLPGVYHKYVGHDNNRDFVTLSQEDTKVIARIYSTEWYPQVMVEKHQMGSHGPRYFVPPMHDPIAENIDAGIWNWTWVFGSNMVKDMTAKGLTGVSQHNLFDDYWPGSTETALWKNMISLLTEAAGVKYATPIYVEPNELRGYGKGLSEYKKSINMALPWPGGWWRLSDIMQYEIESTKSMIKTCALHREELLKFRNDLCRREVQKGKTEAPFFYLLPADQHDTGELFGLIKLLQEHGITVNQLQTDFNFGVFQAHKDDFIIALAQPYRSFIKEVIERQTFPVRHYTPNGKIIKPYDITSWSLPLHRGVRALAVNAYPEHLETILKVLPVNFKVQTEVPEKFWAAVLNVNYNESFQAAFKALGLGFTVKRLEKIVDYNDKKIPNGSFVVFYQTSKKKKLKTLLQNLSFTPLYLNKQVSMEATSVKMPRIALVETFFHDMDAGWTRFIFDRYRIPYTVKHPGDFEKTNFAKDFDVLVFPDADKNILMQGKWKNKDSYYVSSYPPAYTKGIGEKGFEKVMTFLDKGGKIISWGRSTSLFMGALKIKHSKKDIEEFQLPITDISAAASKDGLYVPGSFMKIELKQNHPLTLGLEKEIGVFYRGRPIFATSFPNFDMDRRVIAKFPEKDILLSGYAEHEEKLADKTVMAWLKKGKGQLVLYGFNPQFRASTQVSFKLIFNALLLPDGLIGD